ncbi:MAG: maleylpyruvate isomerase N-terminal domain-containing protein [Actinomycetes bacterium]
MASQMEFSAYLAAIIAESGGLLDALGVHPSAPVADCPGWDVADLVRHTGSTHRWATAHLVAGLAGSISPAPAPDADVAASDLHEWFADGVTELVALLADCGPAQN